jgi:probable HAF family extracellular repeat protein
LVINLGSFGGAKDNHAGAINNRGQVAGWSDLPGDTATHAIPLARRVMRDLGTLPGDLSSFAYRINDRGVVLGQSCNSDFSVCRAFLWHDGVMMDVNTLIPAGSLFLTDRGDINNRGEIVVSLRSKYRERTCVFGAAV